MKTVRRFSALATRIHTSRTSLTVADDVEAFGPAAALALQELPRPLAEMNRLYRHLVARRALLTPAACQNWIGQRVNVFLRHDAVYVFAIHRDAAVAMANCVELRNVSFVVDQTGRQQTLKKTGTLPNLSTVHAFVSGDVISIEDAAPDFNPADWHPVFYRPDHAASFTLGSWPNDAVSRTSPVASSAGLPLLTARHVLMIPGRTKVWCQRPVCGEWPQTSGTVDATENPAGDGGETL